ncbi:gamma-aminobutyric acid type B receptor subunit 2-like [Mya arenaria]|uniref:gamma-aminobutyric acid type B receptor subunit 2-like n=1 Tax=Mya arenaria TaxID=6604 RepID=UPI0022E8FBE6|nr:gamma-aminobutyric acid type B receptor subunit 2-like [Mya arenaria]
MGDSSLVGISGRLSFSKGGADPDKSILLQRIQGGERLNVGYVTQNTNTKRTNWIEGVLKWKDNIIPRDSTSVTYREVTIPPSMYITLCTLAACGIILALTLFGFNIVFRKNRSVKMSSPNINNVLLFGCVLCYITVFMKPTETKHGAICKARVCLFCIGFTVTFGALFSKTWRVYRIFTNKKLLKRTIKDYQLLAIIGILIAVVTGVLIAWEAVGPHSVVVQYLGKEVHMEGNDAEVRPFVRMCRSDYSVYFAWAIYIIEGALLSFGAFLAWETRHVKIEALNDSHQIGLCLYNVVVLSAVGLTLSLLLEDEVVMLYGITSGCLIIGTTVTQLVVFLPKIHAVYSKVEIAVQNTGVSTSKNRSKATNATSIKRDLSAEVLNAVGESMDLPEVPNIYVSLTTEDGSAIREPMDVLEVPGIRMDLAAEVPSAFSDPRDVPEVSCPQEDLIWRFRVK